MTRFRRNVFAEKKQNRVKREKEDKVNLGFLAGTSELIIVASQEENSLC